MLDMTLCNVGSYCTALVRGRELCNVELRSFGSTRTAVHLIVIPRDLRCKRVIIAYSARTALFEHARAVRFSASAESQTPTKAWQRRSFRPMGYGPWHRAAYSTQPHIVPLYLMLEPSTGSFCCISTDQLMGTPSTSSVGQSECPDTPLSPHEYTLSS